jgi:hypothetical protein
MPLCGGGFQGWCECNGEDANVVLLPEGLSGGSDGGSFTAGLGWAAAAEEGRESPRFALVTAGA